DLGLDLVQLLVRGDRQRGALIASLERLHPVPAAMHVAAALDEVLALEARVEDVRSVGDDDPFAPLEHVLRTELAGLLAELLASRRVDVCRRRAVIVDADVAPQRAESLAADCVRIEYRQAGAVDVHHAR